jgi:phosphoglycerate dehydrogenase-like enzyme
MTDRPFPDKDTLTIQFAHVAYAFADAFAARSTGIAHFQTTTPEDTLARLPEADVLVISGFWRPELAERATKLRFIQVLSVGYEQFDLDDLRARGIHLANGSGVNKNAVSEHALALMLSFTRQVHLSRDNQHKCHWRGMMGDISRREQELGGKRLVIYGLGDIGARIARLARAFGMHVTGIKRDTSAHDSSADEVREPSAFHDALAQADFVVLACPLTEETRGLIGSRELAVMPAHSRLINVARGGCVDENALIAALERGEIAGAGLDTVAQEPLPDASPLWGMENVLITPHTGGETERYEENLFDILLENIEHLQRGEFPLRNQRT